MAEPRTWMKDVCDLCPYSRTRTLMLHPLRAEEFANMAQNPYNDFVCHKTGVEMEDTEYRDGGIVRGPKSLTCNGFLSMQVNENDNAPEGFEPSRDAFDDYFEMIGRHEELWIERNPDYDPNEDVEDDE